MSVPIVTKLMRLLLARSLDLAGQLFPLVLQLFAARYCAELSAIHFESGDGDLRSMKYLEQVKYVCEQISGHDYHNFKWSIGGDITDPGDTIRVMHPVFTDCCLTWSLTPKTSKDLVQIFSKAARATSLEEFLKGESDVND
jgi:hypothetical protein